MRRRPAASSSPTTSSCVVGRISASTSSPARDSSARPAAGPADRHVPHGVGAGGLPRADGRMHPDHRRTKSVTSAPGTACTAHPARHTRSSERVPVRACSSAPGTVISTTKRSGASPNARTSHDATARVSSRTRARTQKRAPPSETVGASSARNAGMSSRAARARDCWFASRVDRGGSARIGGVVDLGSV